MGQRRWFWKMTGYQSPQLKTVQVFEQKDLATHVLGTDARAVLQFFGSARSAVEQTDWHDQAERAFLTQLAQHLEEALASGKTKSLIIVASPRALGMIRRLIRKP